MLTREIASMGVHNVQYWPLFLLQGDAHVGCAGLRPYTLKDQTYEMGFHLRPEYEMGFHLRPDYWGRGLAVEAGQAIIAFAFGTLGAHALFAGHHPANAASRKVLEKLGFGFAYEEFYPPTGLMHPSYLLTSQRRP